MDLRQTPDGQWYLMASGPTDLFQLFRHAEPALAAKAKTEERKGRPRRPDQIVQNVEMVHPERFERPAP